MVVWNGKEVSEREKHSDLLGNGTRAMDEYTVAKDDEDGAR